VLLDKIGEIGALLADKAYDAEQRVLVRKRRLVRLSFLQKVTAQNTENTMKKCTSGGI